MYYQKYAVHPEISRTSWDWAVPSSEGLRLELCKIDFFCSKDYLGKKKVKKFLVQNNHFGQKNFWVEIFFGSKIFFGWKNFLVKKIWGQKILGIEKIIFGPKKNFDQKFLNEEQERSGRINQKIAPPPEISRVKVVLACCQYC